MDHVGEFFVVALLNADTKLLSTVPIFSDIHIIHPYFKTIKCQTDKGQALELPVVQINEPETIYVNLLNMKGSAAPAEFANKVFSN